MATVYSEQVTNETATPRVLSTQSHFITRYGKYTSTSTTAAGDVIQMVTLPAGYVVVGMHLEWEDWGTDVDFDVGITGVDVDGYIDGATNDSGGVALLGGGAGAGGVGIAAQSADDTIDILIVDGGSISITAGKAVELYVLAMKNIES